VASPSTGGAVDGSGRKEGGGGLLGGATLEGRSGVERITSVIKVPSYDSPATLGGVLGAICKPSSSSSSKAARSALSLATIACSASSAPVRPRASALPWLLRCTTRLLGAGSGLLICKACNSK
jgi:hypothetical protein